MKRFLLFTLSIALIPGALAQPGYKQKIFVFSASVEAIEGADSQKECEEGLEFIARKYNYYDISPSFTTKTKIYAVDTWDRTGKITDHTTNEIGEILICQDWQTYVPEKNLVPVYHEITIGGRKYRAAGAGTNPNFSQFEVMPGGGSVMNQLGYPEEGVDHIGYTASVFPASDGKAGGMLHMGNLGPLDGVLRDYYNHNWIGVLHVTVPEETSGE